MTAMKLYMEETDPVAECECGYKCHGDSVMDALRDWAGHVAETPKCRENLG